LVPAVLKRYIEELLYYELTKLGLKVDRQLFLPIEYEELTIENAYKLDLIVEDMLILELKSIYPLPTVFFKTNKDSSFFIKFKARVIT
jgi:GxxExxY protein